MSDLIWWIQFFLIFACGYSAGRIDESNFWCKKYDKEEGESHE